MGRQYGAVVVVMLLMVVQLEAAEKDKDIKPLDLSNMRAHEKFVDVS